MKKRLHDYIQEYNLEISKNLAHNSAHTCIVKREIWIFFKFTVDENINPQSSNFNSVINRVKEYDKGLYAELLKGRDMVNKEIFSI